MLDELHELGHGEDRVECFEVGKTELHDRAGDEHGAAGEALLDHGRHALNAVGAAAQSARRAGEAPAHLRLVIKPGGDANLLSGILAAYAGQTEARRVDILFGGATDRADHRRDPGVLG